MRKTIVKCICAILCVVALNVGIWGSVFCIAWYANMPAPENFYESAFCWHVTEDKLNLVEEGLNLWKESEEQGLSRYDSRRLEEIEAALAMETSNFRFAVYGEEGNLLFNNAGHRDSWEKDVYNISFRIFDRWEYSENRTEWWVSYTAEFGVLYPLQIQDGYVESENLFRTVEQYMPLFIGGSIACVIVGLVLLILLLCSAGRRPGRDDVVLNWHDRIPYDLYLAVQFVLNGLCWGLLLVEGLYYVGSAEDWAGVLWVGGASVGGTILVLALLLTTAARIKGRMLFRNTVIWRICKLFGRIVKWTFHGVGRAVHALPMVWRIVVLFLAYLVGTVLTAILLVVGIIWCSYDGWAVFLTVLMIVAIPAYHGFALWLLCRWSLQWRKIREATGAIVSGQTEVKIAAETWYPDLREHAGQLNDLGSAIDCAVEERMKSERFKAELITNVSHDLKTPLTSIINYVDLLKKEKIGNPTAQEYIEVLDRKSQRLKKLTEDLVEASKASTGTLTVSRERLDVVQLIRQALGEYEEKLAAAGLILMTSLPEQSLYINADGRHVWRVLDNLLGNCTKYAMEHTRVYLDVAHGEGDVVITVKNISRQPLNVPAEQLLERFVRGEESRTTEGSGLGLSIARSLTELQGGRFVLEIDGDLFKANVILPVAE